MFATETWETVAVTALPPGWFNWFEENPQWAEGDPEEPADPTRQIRLVRGKFTGLLCPALLVQELRADRDGVTQAPFRTRTVYADPDGFGGLEPAVDTSNYHDTTFVPGWELEVQQ